MFINIIDPSLGSEDIEQESNTYKSYPVSPLYELVTRILLLPQALMTFFKKNGLLLTRRVVNSPFESFPKR